MVYIPRRAIIQPHTGREYMTNGVPEEALQNFGACQFVMRSANGRFIVYDGVTAQAQRNIRFAPEPPHNWSTYREGRNLLEVLEIGERREIEIDVYNNGTPLTEADLAIGKRYGLTRIAKGGGSKGTDPNLPDFGRGGNETDQAQWVVDVTKTANVVVEITANMLRGFLATGRTPNGWHTGYSDDITARVLVKIIDR